MAKFKEFMIGFRKLAFGATFFVVSLVLLLLQVLTGADWIKYNSAVVIAFFSTNVGEHLIEIGKKWLKSRQDVDIRAVMDKIKDK